MALTFDQQQAIAALSDNPGYQLVLEMLRADIDDVLALLAEARSEYEERRLLSEWRALRGIYHRLVSIPESVREHISPELERLHELLPALPQTEEDFRRAYKTLGRETPRWPNDEEFPYGNIETGE